MKLMVIDGNSIINRAFYGIRPLSTREGVPTNAVYGFISILQKLIEEDAPEALCVTFDLKAPTFRHEKCCYYKAQRKPMPEELAQQLPIMKEVLDLMNIPRYELEGYEADDLIGTISRLCEKSGWHCEIVTGDNDSLQLITDRTAVKIVSTYMGKTSYNLYGPAEFMDKYGFEPVKLIDLKALMGDTSDNIPGVAGVGQKTATDLIQKYGTIENIYKDLDALDAKPAVKTKLAAGRDAALESRWLAEIRCDAPIDFTPEKNLRSDPKPELYDMFLKLEFLKFIEKFRLRPTDNAPATTAAPKIEPVLTHLTDSAAADALLAEIEGKKVAVLWVGGTDVLCIAAGERAWVFTPDALPENYGGFIEKLFTGGAKIITHNAKDLLGLLLQQGIEGKIAFDTALAAYLLAATESSYPVAKLTASYLGAALPDEAAFRDEAAFTLLGAEESALTALAAHTAALLHLEKELSARLENLGMHDLFYDVELPLCAVLADMERTGCLVDKKALAEYGENLSAGIEELQRKIYDHAGEQFNINSPKQLGEILFEKLGLPSGKKTKTGYSTNAEVLEKLVGQHPIVSDILNYRKLTKLKSTYADGLIKVIGPDGRIHTSFQMTVTATGRLSSVEPNLQNIPTRSDLGAEIRKMFIPAPGCVLVDADYSQIELRILAHMASDEIMLSAFEKGEDIHTVTASQVFSVPADMVSSSMRSRAKAVNFGIVYGISEFSLAQDIGVAVWEAREYMQSYFAKYSGVKNYMNTIVEQAKADGFVSTIMNRRRDLPELKSSNFNMRAFGQRVALNMPIQGSAADIMKLAMVRVWRRLREEELKSRIILQVHDELIIEAPENEAERVARILEEEMSGAVTLKVPLIAQAAWGHNWLEAKK
ncbi:MAG: DNA polymerase I [Oscillospiraceae bacterium]|nr:DNA polymerase I [Oscillospiraceae bacterium]